MLQNMVIDVDVSNKLLSYSEMIFNILEFMVS
jgi:hypothetical protein